jgi:hypothetical protein
VNGQIIRVWHNKVIPVSLPTKVTGVTFLTNSSPFYTFREGMRKTKARSQNFGKYQFRSCIMLAIKYICSMFFTFPLNSNIVIGLGYYCGYFLSLDQV